ncbi:MAG: hypothetical protein ACTSPA_10985 [Promethearchaeota archaeon]
MNEKETKKKGFSINFKPELIETELDDIVRKDDIVMSIGFIIICGLLMWFNAAHQTLSTGFFTIKFGIFEMVLLYGALIYWIVTCTFLLLGLKNASRNLDSFGGLIFAAFGTFWLFVVFPFDFAYFEDVLPESIRFLVQWIPNWLARVVMVLGFIMYLFLSSYAGMLRVVVLKERARRKELPEIQKTKENET